jgi:two-component system, LytTR family, response regulator
MIRNHLVLKSDGKIVFIHFREIHWIEAEGKHIYVHLQKQSLRVRGQISEVEEKLDPEIFVRLNRSAIVNLDFIQEMIPWFRGTYKTVLRDATELVLSRNYRDRLFAHIPVAFGIRTLSVAK